jgi:hypothetical protein
MLLQGNVNPIAAIDVTRQKRESGAHTSNSRGGTTPEVQECRNDKADQKTGGSDSFCEVPLPAEAKDTAMQAGVRSATRTSFAAVAISPVSVLTL